jgi:hypothetical protein
MGRPKVPQVAELNPAEISERGINLRTNDAFPRIMKGREEFDPQFAELDRAQLERAAIGQSDIQENIIAPSLGRQRSQFLGGDIEDINQFASPFRDALLKLAPSLGIAEEGLQSDERILNMLRGQAESDLALGGDLSEQDIRAVEQGTASNVGRRGRGAGAFGVGQLALNRDAARRGRESERRGFAGGVFGLGGQQLQRRQSQAQQFSSPFFNAQAQNRQLVGSPLQHQGFAQQSALASTPQFPVFDPTVTGMAQNQFAFDKGFQQQQKTARQNFFPNIIGGVIGAGTQIAGAGGFGDPFGVKPAPKSTNLSFGGVF